MSSLVDLETQKQPWGMPNVDKWLDNSPDHNNLGMKTMA